MDDQLHYSPTSSKSTYSVLDLIIFQVQDAHRRIEEATPAPLGFFFRYLFDPILFLIIMVISFRFWQMSLKNCIGDIMVCFDKMKEGLGDLMVMVVYFAALQFLILLRAVYSRVLAYRVIAILLVLYSYMHINSGIGEFSWADHSQANVIVANMSILGMIGFFSFVIFNWKLFRTSKKYFFAMWTFFAIVIVFFYFKRVHYSCSSMNDSIMKGYEYQDMESQCKWNTSQICWHNTLYNVFEPIHWFRSDCRTIGTDLRQHKKAAGKSKIMAFPDTGTLPYDIRTYYRKAQEWVMDNLTSAEPEDLKKGEKEVFIDFRKFEEGELIIRLKDI